MASPRYLFGSGASDFAIAPPSRHGGFVVSAASLGNGTLWSSPAGGVQYTDLQTVNGGSTSTISTDKDGGIVPFFGPAGVDEVWLDFGGGSRVLLTASTGIDSHVSLLVADPASATGAWASGVSAAASSAASAASAASTAATSATATAAAAATAAQAAADSATAALADYAKAGVDATQRLMSLLTTRNRDQANILFVGDSTGNEPSEWIRLLVGQIATDWPAWTVRYRLWNDTTLGYDAYETVQTGSAAIPSGVKVRDTFSRTAADLYGSTPDIGGAWTGATNATGDWSLNGTQAVRTSDAALAPVVANGSVQGDQTIVFSSVTLSTTATGAVRTFNIYPKYIDGSNYLWVRLQVAVDGSVSWNLFKTVAGANTTLATGSANPVAANTASVTFSLTVTITGASVSVSIGAATMSATLSQADQDFFMGGTSFGFSASAAHAGMTIDSVEMSVVPLIPGPTLSVWNASVPGFACQSWQGSRFAPAIADLPALDLMLLSMGHNESTLATRDLWHSSYVNFTEQLTAAQPSADLICVAQNPETINPFQAQRAEIYREIAARRGYGFIDAHQAFVDSGNVAALVGGDGIHPNTAGSILWANTVKAAFRVAKNISPRTQTPSTFTTTGEQLVVNGDFADFAGALPSSWTAVGTPTVTKDTTNYESKNGYGVMVTAVAAGDGIKQDLPISKVRGKWITVTVRSFTPESAGTGAGRVAIIDSDGDTTALARGYGMGAYRWQTVTRKISKTATTARVVLYGDTATAGGTATFDRVVVTWGRFPRVASAGDKGATGSAGSNPGQTDFMSTLGNHPAVAMFGIASNTMTTANQAILVRFRPFRDISVSELHWFTAATSSGNYDIGVYDSAGNRLWSKGSTAWGAANTAVVAAASGLSLTAGGNYFIAFASDAITGTWRGSAESVTDQVKMLDGSYFSLTVPNSFPLPATITPGSVRAGKAPLVTIHG